ncbi:hypothetical protein G9A89_020956 [Geosiphon pyriformis]|nr:hypothetical protein G9A89_020956 [Geosiphon pyriformis]
MAKTQYIRKIFLSINGFGGVTTLSKFEGIIRLTFTSEKSLEMTASLAREKRIDVNSDLKRQGMRSDQTVVIKKILINTPKDMIVATVSEFGEIKLIKIQLIGMWQKAVVEFAELSQADLTTAHDLGTLLKKTGGKTCVINRSLETGNRICCAVVGFEFDNNLKSVFCTEPIFGGVKLSWARIDLVWCEKCRKFDHSALECDAPVVSPSAPPRTFKRVASNKRHLQLAKLYEKKSVLISCPTTFGGKFWAQVVLLAGPSDGSHFSSGFGSSFLLSGASDSNIGFLFTSDNNSSLNAHLAILERFLEFLIDWVSGILKKLSGMGLILMITPFSVPPLATSLSLVLHLDVDMAVNNMLLASALLLSAVDDVIHDSSSSFSKVLTSKVGGLELKMVAFEVLISSVLERLDHLCSGAETKLRNKTRPWLVDKFDDVCMFSSGLDSGYVGASIAIVINKSLDKLLFKNKLLVSILGLYTGAFLATQFFQADEINFLIARAINKFSFVILGAANKENNSEIFEEESIDSENKENEMTAYITKIPKFNREDIETSLPTCPEDLNSAIQHAKRYEMAIEEANHTKLVNLAIEETSSAAEEKIDQLAKKQPQRYQPPQRQNQNNFTSPSNNQPQSCHYYYRKLQRDQQNRSNQCYPPPQQSCYQLPPPAYYPPTPQYQTIPTTTHTILSSACSKIKPAKLIYTTKLIPIPQNPAQPRSTHYHTQSSYLTIPKEQDFHHTALLESRAAAQQQNPFYTPTTILPARIAENANLSDIFPFEFEANESPFLLSNVATNKQKAITAMYTEAEVKGKAIRLILDSGSTGSIITYQLMQQLKRNIN